MLTRSETLTVPLAPVPSSFFSRLNFSLIKGTDNRRTKSLREANSSMIQNTVNKMATRSERGRRDSSDHNRDQRNQQQQEATSGSAIARSMSRYRRPARSVTVNVDATQKINSDPPPPWDPPTKTPVSTILRPSRTASMTQKGSGTPITSLDSPSRHLLRHNDSTRRHTPRQNMADHHHQSRPSTAKSVKSTKSEESAWRRLASRDGRRRRLNSVEDDEAAQREMARLEAENRRLLIEQKKKDLARLEMHLANSQPTVRAQPHKPKSPVIEKFVSLTRGRKNRDGLSPGLSPSSSNTSIEPQRTFSNSIEPGGKGAVPQTDAPQSAINAGDRVSIK